MTTLTVMYTINQYNVGFQTNFFFYDLRFYYKYKPIVIWIYYVTLGSQLKSLQEKNVYVAIGMCIGLRNVYWP